MPMGLPARDLEVRHCRVLLAVADTGGIGAAARALGVAQSTISETLLALERLIGAPVMRRKTGRSATLTAVGETLVPHARLLVSASEAARAAVAPEGRTVLRLGAVESISSFLLPRPLSAFRLLWPQVDMRISIGLCEDLRARVARGELDAALTIEGALARHAGCAVQEIAPMHLRFVVSPRHPFVGRSVKRWDLQTQTFLLTDHEGAFNALQRARLGDAKHAPKLDSAGSIDGVKRGVVNGDAIGVLPDYAALDEVVTGVLVALELDDAPPPISLRLTTQKSPESGSPVEGLIGQVRAALVVPGGARAAAIG